jgi:hypothetical protein
VVHKKAVIVVRFMVGNITALVTARTAVNSFVNVRGAVRGVEAFGAVAITAPVIYSAIAALLLFKTHCKYFDILLGFRVF